MTKVVGRRGYPVLIRGAKYELSFGKGLTFTAVLLYLSLDVMMLQKATGHVKSSHRICDAVHQWLQAAAVLS